MSRYIDAEWIRNVYADFKDYEGRDDWTTPISNVLAVIDGAPSIDIVRCKECKFSESVITSWSTDGKNNVVERLCKVHKWSVKDDDYCSYAERKESE